MGNVVEMSREFVMPISFDRGDILLVDIEQKVGCPVLVVSKRQFNVIGESIVVLIARGDDIGRYAGFAVDLCLGGVDHKWFAIVNKIRVVDLQQLGTTKVGEATETVMYHVMAKLLPIFE